MVKLLSPGIQNRIRELRERGMSKTAIAQKLRISRKTVAIYSKMRKVKTKRHWICKAGRPPILTADTKRKARLVMKQNHIKMASQLTSIMKIKCCKQTSRNLLHSLLAKRTRNKLRPLLTATPNQTRLAFAEAHIGDEQKLRRTVFSDEKKFCLTGPDEYQKEWKLPDEPSEIVEQSPYRNESVMVWGAIGHNYKAPLHVFDSTVDAQVYIEMLCIHFLPHVFEHFGPDFYFIQDNAPPHRAIVTKHYLFYKNVEVLEWPPYSPDLNCIEHAWNLLSRRVYQKQACFRTVAELTQAIFEAWDSITLDEVNALVDSTKNRLRAAIKVDGGHTDY
jgi:predicted transcriptional regulator